MSASAQRQKERRLVAEFVAKQGEGGATDEDIARNIYGIGPNDLLGRRGELWMYGIITDRLLRTKMAASGLHSKVWHITKKGVHSLGLPPETWSVAEPE